MDRCCRGCFADRANRRVGLLVMVSAMLVATVGLPARAADAAWGVGPALEATKAKLAAGEQANIVIFGDSLSFEGLGWSSWVPTFRERMRTTYGDAGYGYQSYSYLTGGRAEGGGKFTGSGPNLDLWPYHGLDGQWLGLAAPGTATDFEAYGNEVELHYYTGAAGGSAVVYDSAGNVLTTLDGSGGTRPGAAAWRHTFTGDDRVLRIESVGEDPFGVLGYNNLSPVTDVGGARIHRASNSGWNTVNYARRDGGFEDQLNLLQADLVMVMIGQNEWSGGGSAFESRLSLIVQRAQSVGADVLLMGSYNSSRWYLPSVMTSQQQVAQDMGAGFVNLYSTAGSKAFWQASGFLYHDGLHFSPTGADYMGEFVFDVFLSDGRSVYPWLLGDMNDDAAFNEADIDPWVLALTRPKEYDAAYEHVWARRSGDFNGDGVVDTQDINGLIAHLMGGSPAVVPEPWTGFWGLVGGAWVLRRRRCE